MNESREALSVGQFPAETATATLILDPAVGTVTQRWARWQEKGARHDARVGWNMRLIAVITLTTGVIWFLALLR